MNNLFKLTYSGNSMSPFLEEKDLLIFNQGEKKLQVGALYALSSADSSLIVHRCVNVDPTEFKGDRAICFDCSEEFSVVGKLNSIVRNKTQLKVQHGYVDRVIAYFSRYNTRGAKFRFLFVLLIILFSKLAFLIYYRPIENHKQEPL